MNNFKVMMNGIIKIVHYLIYHIIVQIQAENRKFIRINSMIGNKKRRNFR